MSRVEVVKIVGPSYCGSTVLGCALNTGDGFFFGSEMYRQLKTFREEQKDGRFSHCDFCGPTCEFWSAELHEALEDQGVDSLPSLYAELAARHTEIDVIIDGSKSIPAADEDPDFVIVPTKHPIRLIASHVYNRRDRLGIESDHLETVGQMVDESWDTTEEAVTRAATRFLRTYRAILSACPQAHVFRTDEAHLDDFQAFRDLERALDVQSGTFTPDTFSEVPSHTIGGNRIPIWMTREASGQGTPDSPRLDYYTSSGRAGDWKIDDKFEQVFSANVISAVTRLTPYLDLCETLEYDATPPTSSP